MKKLYIFIIAGILFTVFVVLLILALSKIITFAFFIGTVVVTFISIIILSGIILLKNKKIIPESQTEEEKQVDKEDEGEKMKVIVNKILFSLDILEYESELLFEDTWNMGDSYTPIYSRKSVGLFEKRIISILINKTTKDKSVKIYDDVKIDDKLIDIDIQLRANALANKPIHKDKRVRDTINPILGTQETVTEEITRKDGEEEKEGDNFG